MSLQLRGTSPAQVSSAVEDRMQAGTLALRPAAADYGVGYYYATNDNGGTLYRSDGSSWTKIAPRGTELGYAEITSNLTSTTLATFQDATGLSVTVTVGDRPIVIAVYLAAVIHSAASGDILLQIVEGATQLQFAQFVFAASTNRSAPAYLARRLAPAAGAHTYKLQWGSTVAGTHTLIAGATTPASIQVVEV